MNIAKTAGAFCALALAAAASFGAPSYFVVCTTDMMGNKTYDVREKEELVQLKKQIAAENKFFEKARAKVQKEWEANKDAHQFKWQGQHLKPRVIKESQPYPDRDKAMAKADKMTDKELGLDDPKKGKTKKNHSEKEEERLYKERMRVQELEEAAQAVQKEIEAMVAAVAAPAK